MSADRPPLTREELLLPVTDAMVAFHEHDYHARR